jgi:hypothetical protein
MKTLLSRFKSIIEILNQNDLQDKVILIGSWAYYVYQNYLFKNKTTPQSLRTMDLDLFVSRYMRLKSSVNLIEKFEEKGFVWNREMRVEIDRFDDGDFKVDLLTEAKGKADEKKGIKIKNLGVQCSSVRFWELLTSKTIIQKLDKKISITIPQPENYILHKLLIAQRRPKTERGQLKKVKDITQAMTIIDNVPIENIKVLFKKQFPKWKKMIKQSLLDEGYEYYYELLH